MDHSLKALYLFEWFLMAGILVSCGGEKQTLAFPKGILADFLRVVELIEEFGPAIGRPYTAPLGKGLFEIRAKGREGIGRSIFCSVRDRKLIILHSVVTLYLPYPLLRRSGFGAKASLQRRGVKNTRIYPHDLEKSLYF